MSSVISSFSKSAENMCTNTVSVRVAMTPLVPAGHTLTFARDLAVVWTVARIAPVLVVDLEDAVIGRTVLVLVCRRCAERTLVLHQTDPWRVKNESRVNAATTTSTGASLTIRQRSFRDAIVGQCLCQFTFAERFSFGHSTTRDDGEQNCGKHFHLRRFALAYVPLSEQLELGMIPVNETMSGFIPMPMPLWASVSGHNFSLNVFYYQMLFLPFDKKVTMVWPCVRRK